MSKLRGLVSLEVLVLSLLILGAFTVRLYRIDIPVADWHSWRQADTAAVSRNFIKSGFDLFLPRYDDLSSLQSGYPNPKGYRLVEFPLYNSIVALLYSVWGVKEYIARLVSIVSSLVSLVCIYLLVRPRLGVYTALFAALMFAFLPYNIYFTRSIFPEVFALSLSLLSLVFMDLWARKEKSDSWFLVFLSSVLAALSLLTKPTAVFVLLPLVYLIWVKLGWKMFTSFKLWMMAVIVFTPLLAWRIWISQFPEGVPANSWLLNGGEIRFKGAWFRWIFAERFGKMILTVGSIPLFVLGLLNRLKPKEGWLFIWMLLGSLAYVTIFARGNIQHDYYQILIIPSLVIMVAKGANLLLNTSTFFNRFVTIPLLMILLVGTFAFGWYEIRGNFNVNHPEIVEAGKVVDILTPRDSKVIAPYGGDTAFLYQTNRPGWPVMDGSVEDLIKKGATVYASVQFDDETNRLASKYATLRRTDQFIVLDLTKPLP